MTTGARERKSTRKYTVGAEQAAHDIGLARELERQAREDLAAQDLRSALDQTEQPAQQTEPVDGVQPEYQMDPAEAAARAETDGAWAKADAEISELSEVAAHSGAHSR